MSLPANVISYARLTRIPRKEVARDATASDDAGSVPVGPAGRAGADRDTSVLYQWLRRPGVRFGRADWFADHFGVPELGQRRHPPSDDDRAELLVAFALA